MPIKLQKKIKHMYNILPFLSQLSQNNNRDWFNEHKEQYLIAKNEMEILVNDLIQRIALFDPTIADLEAKKCVFRIYRDVRFSKNKAPYKTNMGGFMVPGGKNSGHAGYYLHLEPGTCFIAGGIYMPESAILKKVREEILYNIKSFNKIIHHPDFKEYFGEIRGEKLKRPPKGFPDDFEDIELLKFKSYNVIHYISDEAFAQNGFIDEAVGIFEKMKDFNHFINQAIG